MYPYQGPGQYGPPGDYGAYGGGAPPGMAPPPGMAAPGMPQQDTHQAGRGGFPPNFNPAANMPNINFSAPVIRLGMGGSRPDGMGGPGGPSGRGDDRDRGGRRAGLGSGLGGPESGRDRDRDRDRVLQIQPQTKEDIIRTIFVGGITDGCGGDEGIERILRAAGGLRRWFRASDADDKPCKFGFAEYEDPESLRTAIEILQDVEVPIKRQEVKKEEDSATEEDEEKRVEKSKLLIVADENSSTYLEQWEESQGGHDAEHKQMLLDHAREALDAVLHDLEYPTSLDQKDSGLDRDGDIMMQDGVRIDAATGEVVTIPLNVEDELADIPAEMRETVSKEIAAFRDRSNRRDLERLKREEEIEQQEKTRMANGRSRLASPPPSAPSGPSGANGIPSAPRGAPSGPKGFGQQIPRDYQKGVVFVNGTAVSGASAFEDDDTEASDSDLEQRRLDKKKADQEKAFLDQERRWLNRERSRTAAIEREKARDADELSRHEKEKEAMAARMRQWNDDVEASKKTEEYYADRSMWIRNRMSFRQREIAMDDADRAADQREHARDVQRRERAGAMADDFLSRAGDEISQPRASAGVEDENDEQRQQEQQAAPREPARFQLKLGAAAQQRAQANAQATQKRTVADVEFLLEDEEENTTTNRRTLVPIQFDPSTAAQQMTDEERAAAAKQLAAEIPNDKQGLWSWDVKWEFVDESIIDERLKPFVEKKIVEYLGVQEDMLVEVVVEALRGRKKAEDLVGELEDALDEEAEVLVKKLWRMVIFFSESEKRGLSA